LVYYVGEDRFKEIDMGRSYSIHMRMRNALKNMDRKPERKRTLGRRVCRRKNAIKTDFKEIIW
jgi:hypothetical protein